VPDANAPQPLRDKIKKFDAVFPSKGMHEELRVLAGAVLRTLLEKGGKLGDIAAFGLLCGSLGSRLDKVSNPEHVDAADRYVAHRANSLRVTPSFPTVPQFNVADDFLITATAAAIANPNWSALQQALSNAYNHLAQETKKATDGLLTAFRSLRSGIDIQLEESNILWWLVGGTSKVTGESFEKIEPNERPLLLGLEIGGLTVMIPGSQSMTAVLDRALSAGQVATGESISILEAVEAVPRTIRESYRRDLTGVSTLCPVLFAVAKSLEIPGPEWRALHKAGCDISLDEKHSRLRLGLQTYREYLFSRLLSGATHG
jgi:hypothetical protein